MRYIKVITNGGFNAPLLNDKVIELSYGDIFEYVDINYCYGLINGSPSHLMKETLDVNIGEDKIFMDVTKQVKRNKKLKELGL